MNIVIEQASPGAADVVALLEAHLCFAAEHSPPEHVHALDLAGLSDPSVHYFTARADGELLAVGALRDLGGARAEVKSMHTAASARGQGVGRMMLEHLIALARTMGVEWLGLETGSMDAFAPARRLYESVGFSVCAPFGSYTDNPFSSYLALDLPPAGESTSSVADRIETAQIETAQIEANGWCFTADVAAGVPGDPPAELVLFLHGFPQTRHTWRAELRAAANAGFRACAFDQRGYSPGARPGDIDSYRIECLVDDVLGVADALGARRFHLVGHDWGGQIAWVTAARHADRVASLAVLSRPHPAAFARALKDDAAQASRSGHHRSFQRPEATDELLTDGAASLRSVYERSGVPAADAEVYLATLGERPALDAAINWYRAVGGSSLGMTEVASVSMPTLYVWGDADSTVGRAAAEATAGSVDGPYRFVELAEVGHFITDEAPAAFPPLLLAHLRAATA